jgi:hypothetical protein
VSDPPALHGLPMDVYAALLPVLDTLSPPDETRATCASCPQAAPPEGPTIERPYLPDVNCCTYHPTLPNYLVGRGLRRGGVGADRLRARIRREAEGILPEGIAPNRAHMEGYSGETFGRERRLTCPFWVPGPLSCSIWQDRNAVCRTWHCRTVDGPRGIRFWETLRDALRHVEAVLCTWLVRTGAPPTPPEDATGPVLDVGVWEAWYVDCAERLDAADPETLAALPFPQRRGLELALRVYTRMLELPRPEDPSLHILDAVPKGEDLLLTGYSDLDRVRVPRAFMAVVGLMAEGTAWPDALEAARERYGITFDDDLAERLWRHGVLDWPIDLEHPPEVAALEKLAEEEGVPLDHAGQQGPPVP